MKVSVETFCRHIRYIGQSDVGDKSRNTLIRSCLDIGTSVNIGKFLSEMGFGYVWLQTWMFIMTVCCTDIISYSDCELMLLLSVYICNVIHYISLWQL